MKEFNAAQLEAIIILLVVCILMNIAGFNLKIPEWWVVMSKIEDKTEELNE